MLGLFSLLTVGQSAPDFALEDANGQSHTLLQYRGQNVILVFYPADFTPGCTGQLCMFRDAFAGLEGQTAGSGLIVLGVNPGSKESHKKFAAQHQLNFPLLSDPGMKVSKMYKAALIPGLLQNRVVYGIDTTGIIRFAKVGNPPAAEVLGHF